MNLLAFEAHQAGRGRPADVNVEKTDVETALGQGVRQLGGDGRLPDAALARENQHLVLDLAHAGRDVGEVGVGGGRTRLARRLYR